MRLTPSPLDSARVRADFPMLDSGLVYLDSAATSLKPRPVVDAVTEYLARYSANVHRGVYAASERATAEYEAVREKVRRFLNARSTREIVNVRGTTEAINLVAYSWGRQQLRPGDLVVLTLLEHHSNIVPWQQAAAATGAVIEYVDIDDRGELRQDQWERLLARGPRLVAFTQVSNALGTINPFVEMTRQAHEAGALVLIDGAQGAPHLGIDVQATDCDFYAFSAHKLFGPTGAGILYGRRELLESMPPFMGGGDMIREVRTTGTTFNELPWKFEAGTPAIAEVIGLGAAIDYAEALGADAIRAHEVDLTEYAIEALSTVPGLRQFGPPAARRVGVLSFEIQGIHAHDVASILDRHQVAIRGGHHCAMPLMERLGVAATSRASLGAYTVREDIDRLVAGLHQARRVFRL